MLKELLSHRPIQVALLLVILIGISGVLYLNHVKTQTEGDTANTETGVVRQETPPERMPDTPADSSAQGGHFHSDGTWHAEPHDVPQTPTDKQTQPSQQETEPSVSEETSLTPEQLQRRHDLLEYEAELKAHNAATLAEMEKWDVLSDDYISGRITLEEHTQKLIELIKEGKELDEWTLRLRQRSKELFGEE